jgi:hypothetical protein
LVSSKSFWISSSVTEMSRSAASCSIHSADSRNDMTWSRAASYCCSHWSLYCSSVVVG